MPPFSAGSWFHSLHATSHALHPMQTVVSVKNPMGSGISRLLHVADERLAFVDRHIGVTHPGGEIVDHISGGEPIQPQCQGMPTWWMSLPPTCITPIRSVTSA